MFDINQNIYDDHGDFADDLVQDYLEELNELFEASPEGQKIQKQYGQLVWAQAMMDHGFNDLEATLPEMTDDDLSVILFELLPETGDISADEADFVVNELKAFWSFLYREFKLSNAPSKIEMLDASTTEELSEVFSTENDDDMTKKLILLGTQSGFDMTTQEGLNQFMAAYNAGKVSLK